MSAPGLGGVHHLAVVTGDLARAEAFYTGVLGLPAVERWDDDAGRPRSVWVSLGTDAFLAIERASEPEPTRGDGAPGWHCVALRIEARERGRWIERLETAGVAVERTSEFTVYVRDPDGNLVGLSHYPEQKPEPADADTR